MKHRFLTADYADWICGYLFGISRKTRDVLLMKFPIQFEPAYAGCHKIKMKSKTLSLSRARQILAAASKARVLVVGDVMLDQFIWGSVARISPEAPVPVVDFERESFMPGGAANVARNLAALNVPTEFSARSATTTAAEQLKKLLARAKHRLRRAGGKCRAPHERQDAHRGAPATGRAH